MSLRRSMIFSLGGAPPLDEVGATSSNTLVAYGFRKLSSTYSGNCLRAQTRTAITGACTANTNTITNIQSGKISLLDVGMFVYVYDGNTDRSTSSAGTIRTITNINTGTNTITLSGNIASSGGTYTGNLYFAYDIPFENDILNTTNTNLVKLKDLDSTGDVAVRILYDQSGNNRYLSLRVITTLQEALLSLPLIYKDGSTATNSDKFCLQQKTTSSQLQVYVNNSTTNTDNFFNNATNGFTAIVKLATSSFTSTVDFGINIFSQTNLTRSIPQRDYNRSNYPEPLACTPVNNSWYGFGISYIYNNGADSLALTPTMRMARSPYINCSTTYRFGDTIDIGVYTGTLSERMRLLLVTERTNNWNNGKSIFSFIDYEPTTGNIATFGPNVNYFTTAYGRGYYNGTPDSIKYSGYPRSTFNLSGSNPFINHDVQELIIFNNTNHTDGTYTGSTERSIVEKNMGRYYNINVA